MRSRRKRREADLVIVDAPPGTACPVVEAVRGCDHVLLVTEPTPFGLHDLELALETVQSLEIPCEVVINRAGLERFCDGGILPPKRCRNCCRVPRQPSRRRGLLARRTGGGERTRRSAIASALY